MKAWILGVCVVLMPVCAVLEWIRFRSPDRAFCQACVPKCPSMSFTIICGVPEPWHRCPACGLEWWGRKDFACLHGDEPDACRR